MIGLLPGVNPTLITYNYSTVRNRFRQVIRTLESEKRIDEIPPPSHENVSCGCSTTVNSYGHFLWHSLHTLPISHCLPRIYVTMTTTPGRESKSCRIYVCDRFSQDEASTSKILSNLTPYSHESLCIQLPEEKGLLVSTTLDRQSRARVCIRNSCR